MFCSDIFSEIFKYLMWPDIRTMRQVFREFPELTCTDDYIAFNVFPPRIIPTNPLYLCYSPKFVWKYISTFNSKIPRLIQAAQKLSKYDDKLDRSGLIRRKKRYRFHYLTPQWPERKFRKNENYRFRMIVCVPWKYQTPMEEYYPSIVQDAQKIKTLSESKINKRMCQRLHKPVGPPKRY